MKHLIDYNVEKSLINYIIESESIQDLKDKIIQTISSIDDEERLKIMQNISTANDFVINKVSKMFRKSDAQYDEMNENILDYLSDGHCGLGINDIYKTIKQKIQHFDKYELFGYIVDDLKNINSKNSINSDIFTKTLDSENIYEKIYEYVGKVVSNDEYMKKEFDDDFKKLIKDIANFNPPGNTTIGKMEILARIFLKDLNNQNKAENKPACDINTAKYGFEFKIDGGRIMGNKENAKPLSPIECEKTFKSLIEKQLDIEHTTRDDYKEAFEKINNAIDIFRNERTKGLRIEDKLDPILQLDIDAYTLNDIIIQSLLAQFKGKRIEKINYEYLFEQYPIIYENNSIKKIHKQNFQYCWLLLSLCNYCLVEQWDYLVVFETDKISENPDENKKSKCTGNYVVIAAPKDINLESIDKALDNKCKAGGWPQYSGTSSVQNYAPQIIYNK